MTSDATEFAVLLDIDGTLLDTTYHHALAWQRGFRDAHLDAPFWRIHRAIGMGGDKLVASVLGDDVEERLGDLLRERWEARWAEVKNEVRPLPGAVALIRRLQGDGVPLALASSGKEYMVTDALDVLGLTEDDFAAVTSSDDADASKPSPDIFEVALEKVGTARGLVIGDTTYDVSAAARAGMGAITVRSGGFGTDELRASGALRVVDSLTELLRLRPDEWHALATRPVPSAKDVRPGQ